MASFANSKLVIDRDTLLQLINRFYAAYDAARQFDEAFSLYQSVVSGDRDAVEVMNALYDTYPSAKTNLMAQALWRYKPEEFASSSSSSSSLFSSSSACSMTFEQIIMMLDSRFGGVGPDLLPSRNHVEKRFSIQAREIVAAYATPSVVEDWSVARALQVVRQIEEQLGRSIRAGAEEEEEEEKGDPNVLNNRTLREMEQFYATTATDDQKQRAALWRAVWESDVSNINSVDAQIKACNGNAVQATRLFREQLRKSMVRIEANLTRKNQQHHLGADDDDGGVSLPTTTGANSAAPTSSANKTNRSGSQTPLPGGDARSSSAQDKKSIEHLRSVLERGHVALEANEKRIREREQELAAKAERTPEDLARFAAIRDELNARERDLQEVQLECQGAASRLNERQLQLEAWEKALTLRESELSARQQNLAEKEEQHLMDSQKRAEALQISGAAVLRREQMAEVKEHVVGQREAEIRRREEALIEREHATDRRAEAIVQRSLELERLMAEYELRSLRVKTREAAIWKSYVNQQLANADPSLQLGGGSGNSTSVNAASLLTLSKELKSVRGHLERLGTVAGSFVHSSNTGNNSSASTLQK